MNESILRESLSAACHWLVDIAQMAGEAPPVPVLIEEAERKTIDALTLIASPAEVIAAKGQFGVTLSLVSVPVLLGAGPRLWDGVDPAALRLERIAVVEMANGRTHLRYRIVR